MHFPICRIKLIHLASFTLVIMTYLPQKMINNNFNNQFAFENLNCSYHIYYANRIFWFKIVIKSNYASNNLI